MSLSEEQIAANLSIHLQRILDQVRHENDLLNHRLTWIWALQGFLMAALGVLLQGGSQKLLALLVCIIGFVSCISIGYSLVIGARVLDRLNPYAAELSGKFEELASIRQMVQNPPEPVGVKCNLSFLLPWKFLPWFLAATWLVAAVLICL